MDISDDSIGILAAAGSTGIRRGAVIVAPLLVLLLVVLSSPPGAPSGPRVAKACSGTIAFVTFTFVPSSSKPGRSSTAHISARNCLAAEQDAELTMVGRFTGKRRPGCPVIDPLARHETFPPHGRVSSKVGYDIPTS